MDSNLILLLVWLLVGLVTMFGLSRLFGFGARSDAHMSPPRPPKPAAVPVLRRRFSPALSAAIPGVLAGLFLLAMAESTLWPDSQPAKRVTGALVEPGPAPVMLADAEPPATEPRKRERSQRRRRRTAPPAAQAAQAVQVASAAPVRVTKPAPSAGSPLATRPQNSRPERTRRRPSAPRPQTAPAPSPAAAATPQPTPTPAPVAAVATAPTPEPTPAAPSAPPGPGTPPAGTRDTGKDKGKDKGAHKDTRGNGHAKGRGKGHREAR